MENAKTAIQNLPWKKIAIGTGVGLTGVLIGMYAFNRCAKQGGQQQQQKGQQAVQQPVPAQQQKQGGQQSASQQTGPQVVPTPQQGGVAAQQRMAAGQQGVTMVSQPNQQTMMDQPPPLEQIGQTEYHNWNVGNNRPANLGHGYADVSSYYRYNPTGQQLPSLHQQESRLMNDGYGTAQLIHEEGEDEMKIGEMHIGNQVQPRNNTNISAVVMDASLDIDPVIRPTGESAPGQMDNFWVNEGPLNFQERQL